MIPKKSKNDTQNDTQKGKNDTQNKSSKLSPRNRRMKILDILENNPKITAQELAKIFLVSKITIRRDMKILVDEGKLEYVGSSRSGFWKIK